ncbi:3-ketosteroid 9alpha-monooxygenase subunit B [Paraburkholderia sp. BL18I3N2]|uniref:ferredoxin--NADP reductase n=1 Tax=Paraburkholderia sp. BL18I3N2 TaxID=1938799 RepID=UPI000D0780DC|nr:ferredoxin--NADP reductase [Paraburkholderia sp. BL18I3N2]PRX27369.1 3-ketosteroid 9alpha-monooxygenase subunit B [Paraburkholderia sp. BL18I3N2]
MNAPKYHTLRVRTVIDETADARSLVFDVPPALTEAFKYRPGQFLTLRLPINGRHVPRCYSLASSPAVDEPLRVTVKRVLQGVASNWVCDTLQAGDEVDVLEPAGVFSPKNLDSDFMLFGGGSGITPILSILRSALLSGRGRICLIYANRDEQSVIFKEELKALASAYPTRLQVTHWLDSVQGIPSVAQLADLARSWRHADCFICGPGAFMDAAVAALHALEIDQRRIHVERFVSLPDDTGENEAPRLEAHTDATVELEVFLDGQQHKVSCSPNETLLDAMLRAGIQAPYSCRAGACATCMCTLEAGKVRMKTNDVLDKNDLSQGWTLACQGVAESPHVVVRFPD